MEVGLRQAQTRQSGNAEGGKKAGGQLISEVGTRKSENRMDNTFEVGSGTRRLLKGGAVARHAGNVSK